MIAPDLLTSHEDIRLIAPDIERDAELSVSWLEGVSGRRTLQNMGVPDQDINEPTLEGEEERLRHIIESTEEVAWMIEYAGEVVGIVEVHLQPTLYIDAPHVSIMIGERSVRRQGVATVALRSVIEWLNFEQDQPIVFARHLMTNESSMQMLMKLGFEEDGPPYADTDNATWQNMILRNEEDW